jgi:hypothetical protein
MFLIFLHPFLSRRAAYSQLDCGRRVAFFVGVALRRGRGVVKGGQGWRRIMGFGKRESKVVSARGRESCRGVVDGEDAG